MKFSDGLFLKEARKVAADYEGRIAFDDRIIDAFCMNLVTDPSQFDVIVFPEPVWSTLRATCAPAW